MRIAIDARLNAYRQGGIPQYTRQLLAALAEVSQEDEFISLQHRDQLRPLAIAPNVARRTAFTPPHHRFEQWSLPLELLLTRAQVLHCPDFIAPVHRPCPAVVTIHDLAFMHYPEILDDAASAYYGQVKSNAPRADAIIAVSEATRQDIAQFLDIPIEQIDVIYEAAAPLYTQLELRPGEARVLNSTPVEADTFMLFVSTLEPRKNVPTLLQALRICLDRKPQVDYRLVVVGRRGWRDEAIFNAVRDLKLGDHVLFAGGVGQYDLRWLYNACRMYINPSLYEGFGLPLLEAMACGAPCLAAATSSLPEIGGDAAIYVPPLDADVWADEIEALWDDQERRAELGRMGIARARRFSWLRAARETLGVYKRAADRIVPAAAPQSAQMRSMFANLPDDQLADLPINQHAVPSPGGPRVCLRCGAEMSAGKLQHHLGMQPVEDLGPEQVLAPRLWACPRCGHVELVVDWAMPVQPDHEAEHSAAQLDPEAAPADAAITNGALGQHDTLADATVLAEPAPIAAEAPQPAELAEAKLAEPEPIEPIAAEAAQLAELAETKLAEPEPIEPGAAEAPQPAELAETKLAEPEPIEPIAAEAAQPAELAERETLAALEAPTLQEPAVAAQLDQASADQAPAPDLLATPTHADELEQSPVHESSAITAGELETDSNQPAAVAPLELPDVADLPLAHAALSEPVDAAASPQELPQLVDVPATDSTPSDTPVSEAPIAEMAVGALPDPAAPSNGIHPADAENGAVPPAQKPNASGARRAQAPPKGTSEPAPPKRRQSRSKRK